MEAQLAAHTEGANQAAYPAWIGNRIGGMAQ
jgi:hypothetical protein